MHIRQVLVDNFTVVRFGLHPGSVETKLHGEVLQACCGSLLNSPLSCASRTQATVALLSAEAKLMALSSGWLSHYIYRQLVEETQTGMGLTTFDHNHKTTITLLTDSTSATSLASRLGVNRRSRHISLCFLSLLWIHDLQQQGEVDIRRVTTAENPADIYTKLLPARALQQHLKASGLLAHADREGGDSVYYVDNADKKR